MMRLRMSSKAADELQDIAAEARQLLELEPMEGTTTMDILKELRSHLDATLDSNDNVDEDEDDGDPSSAALLKFLDDVQEQLVMDIDMKDEEEEDDEEEMMDVEKEDEEKEEKQPSSALQNYLNDFCQELQEEDMKEKEALSTWWLYVIVYIYF